LRRPGEARLRRPPLRRDDAPKNPRHDDQDCSEEAKKSAGLNGFEKIADRQVCLFNRGILTEGETLSTVDLLIMFVLLQR
jgi:hypothetical protein